MTDSGTTADLARIKRMIPHRYPFLLIDRVEQIRRNESAIGVKNVTNNEPFFQGHFPDKPIMPGVMIVEAMAQTAGVLVVETLEMQTAETGSARSIIRNVRHMQEMLTHRCIRVVFQPVVAGGRVYVSGNTGTLYCLETGDARDDGWLMWGGNAAHNGPAK